MVALTYPLQVFDSDGDQSISYKELKKGLKKIDIDVTLVEVKALVKEVDADGCGQCQLQELEGLLYNHQRAKVAIATEKARLAELEKANKYVSNSPQTTHASDYF
jgi:hypothetical protein